MSNEIAVQKNAMPAMAMNEDELINVLRNSLYPNAQTDSIKLVMGYCRASGLDPMQKPVQIVPMWNRQAGRLIDVIMPGIGLYRTQAARSGQYAGVTEPEFGEDVTENIGGIEVTYPKWCKVVVKRLLPNGTIAEFAATERWKENYAVKGGKDKSIAPNAMWAKRTYGQLAKCAEAQALRKAFPECGSQPTADEMEGKTLDDGAVIDGSTGEIVSKRTTPQSAAAANVSDGYGEFEADTLPSLQEAAEQGSKALETTFKALPKSAHKASLWTRHGAALKDSASTADFVNAPEPEEVTT